MRVRTLCGSDDPVARHELGHKGQDAVGRSFALCAYTVLSSLLLLILCMI